jgi:glycosyltransferase involved in cell wall biosynthesis
MKFVFGHHLTLKSIGGGEKWVINTATEFAKRGYDVEIYSTPIKVAGGIPNEHLDEMLNGIPYKEAYRHKIGGDVNYITYHPMTFLNYNVTRGKIIKGIHATTCWEPINFKYGFLPVQAQILHKLVGGYEFKHANAIHTVAPQLKINHPNVYKIPNFVDSTIFKPFPRPDKFTVTFASRKSYQKGWDIFQEVQKRFEGKDIQFKVSGDIPETEMPKFIAESHIGLVPARYDSFGLSIVEFLMTGTDVITSTLSSHTALDLPLFYADDVDEICTTIEMLKNTWEGNQEKTERFDVENRNRALVYDKKPIMDRLENMFLEVYSK